MAKVQGIPQAPTWSNVVNTVVMPYIWERKNDNLNKKNVLIANGTFPKAFVLKGTQSPIGFIPVELRPEVNFPRKKDEGEQSEKH